jgi:hypothetical protein
MNATETGRNTIMKKTLIAFAALASLAAGMAATASTAEAKIHLNLFVNGGGFYDPGYYGPSYYDDSPDCGYVTVKKVKWINGHKHVFWKKQLICG